MTVGSSKNTGLYLALQIPLMKNKLLPLLICLLAFINPINAQTLMPIPPHDEVYSAMARGYWFTAPCPFTITGLRIPPEAGTGLQNIHVFKCNTPFPITTANASTNFTTLTYINNAPNGVIQNVNIAVNTGDVIGILGTAGQDNSYSASAVHTSTIGGFPVYLTRLGYQGDIDLAPAPNYWGEAANTAGQISRIEMYYTTGPCTAPPTPGTTTASSSLVCAGTQVNLGLSGTSFGSGQTYQWQSSTTQTGTYTNIGSSTTAPSLSINPTTTLWYRAEITCSGNTVQSAPVQVSVTPAFSGTYTINFANPTGGTNFKTFNDAINALKNCSITGPVILNVVPGSGPYNERVSIPAIPGSSATNTVTINGNNNTLTYAATASASRATLQFDGADNIIVNDLKIDATGTSYAWCVHMYNDADNNTINGCTLTSSLVDNGTAYGCIVISGSATSPTSDGSDCDNITINGCTLIGGNNGINMYGDELATTMNNCKITNNIIKDFYENGIDIEGHNNMLIEGNDISRPTRTATGTFIGISAAYVINTKISKNHIHNTNGGHLASTTCTGILVEDGDATAAAPNIVSNNVIHNFNSSAGTHYGMESNSSDNTHYYYNTVSMDFAGATSGTTRGFYQTGAATGVVFKNNIISITRGGSGTKYCTYRGTSSSAIEYDYNVYYMNAPAGSNNLGYAAGAKANLAAWRSYFTPAQDVNSVEGINPAFTSAATGDLTPTATGIDNKGTPIAGITTDIKGNARSTTTPDVGAYEFPLAPCTAPAGLAAASITATTANLSWTAVPASLGYEYAVTTSATPPASGTATTATTYNAGTYIAGTTYYLHVRNKCGTTNFSSWTTYSFTTTCPAPATPSITAVGLNGATISWTAVTGATGYEYAVTTSATPPASGTATTATTHSPNALTASTTYYAHLRTKCAGTNYSAWTTASFTTLTCSAIGTPNVTGVTYNTANISWVAVSGATGYEYAVTTSATPPASGTSTTATTYNPNTLNGSTTYYVHVRTQCNATTYSAWTTTNFTTLTPPCDAPATPVITGVTHNSANITWTAIAGAVGYEYAVNTSATPPASGTGTTATTHNPSGLTQGTTYYIHVRTQCGTSLFSGWTSTSFTTGFPPCPQTAGITVTGTTANSANISWVAVPGALDYEYAITTSPIPPASGTITTTTAVTPNTLSASTTYYVHVRSRCAGSMYSAWVTTMFNTTVCVAPGVASISSLGYTSATISWSAIVGSQGYEYAVTTSATPPVSGTATTATTFNATALTSATMYYVHLRNKCAAGNFSAWATTSFTTLSCGTVTPLVSGITFTTADITWLGAPASLGYEYTLSTVATPPLAGTPTTATSYNATNLLPGTTYYMHIRNLCEANVWSAWTTVSFNTLGCDKPLAPAVQNITFTSADMSWTAVSGASGYEYAVTLNGYSPIITTATSGTTAQVSNLAVGTTYNLYLRTVCQGIYKSPWEVIIFRTKDHPTSVANADGKISIEAYPNPATDKLTVKLNGLTNAAGKLQLTDIAGRSLRMVPVTAAETTISLDGLASGIYMLQYIDANNSATTIRITKQ
jgi:hypothetical protein